MTPGVPAHPYPSVHSHVHLARTYSLTGRRGAGHSTKRRRLHARLTDLPLLVRAGLIVLTVGALGDFMDHALPATFAPLLGVEGFRAHLVTFVGMLIMIVGVFRQGLTQPRSLVARGGVSSHAHR